MSKASFNLVHQPWIPCSRPNGVVERFSILDLLLQAHHLQGIAHASPLVPISVLRLLLAILHRALDGPQSVEQWHELWLRPILPEAPIRNYLGRWAHRFDLFDETRPFYQDPALGKLKPSSRASISKLFHQSASGNNDTLFDHTLDSDPLGVSFPEAALQLLATQTFAVGGLVTPDPTFPQASKSAEGSPSVKGVLLSIVGQTLRESLLLNLGKYRPTSEEPFGHPDDAPDWERDTAAGLITRAPRGATDLLTWQARRIHLFSSDGATLSEVIIMKGAQVPESFSLVGLDSMIAWRLVGRANQRTWTELSFQPDRAVWRDAHSLYASQTEGFHRPPAITWLHRVVAETLDGETMFAVDACGLGTSKAKILSWHGERLPLPGSILLQRQLVEVIQESQSIADGVAGHLRTATGLLAKHLLRPNDPQSADPKAAGALASALSRTENFWSEMEAAFYRLVYRLASPQGGETDPDTGVNLALQRWTVECKAAASFSFALTLSAAGRSSRTYQAVAHAERNFHHHLRNSLPLAFNRKNAA